MLYSAWPRSLSNEAEVEALALAVGVDGGGPPA